ncbi:MAG: YfhO family protein [Prevotellaceae bacterium]|jgi:hypothetical protein|nr:YfhO family protein [Prevotellaceae bacterium]
MKETSSNQKHNLPYIVAPVIFLILSLAYFMPEIFQNKVLHQHDMISGLAIGQEKNEFTQQTGERTLWTNSLFGGMPLYQIAPGYPSLSALSFIQRLTWLYFLPSPANLLFIMLIGAFILFMALRINPWLSIAGAIAYAFSSYFIIIIQAGHLWKFCTLAYIPPTFAGIIWAYRGKYLLGTAVTALYLALQLVSNHPQMTYYFGLLMLIYIIGEFIVAVQRQALAQFFAASAMLALAAVTALSVNLTNMYHTAEYAKYSIRGGSELSRDGKSDKTEGGLERSYITGWSYGQGESFSLLIPNAKGGASGLLGNNRAAAERIRDEVQSDSRIPAQAKNEVARQLMYQNSYWANQPGTSGPVYAGAFVMFLFIFGLFIARSRLKWVLLAGTLMSLALSWGSNMMWLTDLMIDNFPYYNKLRAVSSMLVIAELCIPILAVMTLNEIVRHPSAVREKRKEFNIALGCTAGLTALFLIAPSLFFDFLSNREAEAFAGAASQNPAIYSAMRDILETTRISVFRADAWRSLIIIGIGAGLVLLFVRLRMKPTLFIAAVTILILADLWNADKRYLNGEHFHPRQKNLGAVVPGNTVDDEILKDRDPNYRVLNLSVDTYNDATTSFRHKSTGGYHAAKLRRYQDLIERYLGTVNASNAQALYGTKRFNVIDMLNTKYLILPDADNRQRLMRNRNAMGNAWFVAETLAANSPDEEIAALADIDPRRTAVIDKHFALAKEPDSTLVASDSTANIKLTDYTPNRIKYRSFAGTQRLAVFSEIYYPKGWHACIDGKETPILRANYILRAIEIPEGEHEIEFKFAPESYEITEKAALAGYVLLFGIILLLIVKIVRR